MIDAYASQERYLRHLLPVWQALPAEERGSLYLGGWLGPQMLSLDASRYDSTTFQRPGPRVLVASHMDYQMVTTGRRAIYMQHGAGQSYGGDSDPAVARASAYAGGDRQERTDLFLVPGPHPAMRCRERYPEIPVAEIGCPALDSWMGSRPERKPLGTLTVVLAFQRASRHGDYPLCAEHASAFPHFAPVLSELTRRYRVLGHGHPRARMGLEAVYGPLGIPWVGYREAMTSADALCVDNSSIGFEAAAIGIPVVWLNAPWYRREVEHGLRFWGETGVGVEVDDPADLVPAVEVAVATRRGWGDYAGREALKRVYSVLDGTSAQVAADAIVALDREEAASWR